eukprot:TRINITY_DN74597_c0_g1_i1.p1 TRINITY_DN74597_c0_g1~~TRINITY_DN74597_c0_g1_i1.p1  ORF type:complete len:364 (-),score=62.74 TRINITY_DN74597_c0_g1_i1:337-1428(-)
MLSASASLPWRRVSLLQLPAFASRAGYATNPRLYTKEQTYKHLKRKEVSFIGAGLAAGQHMAGVEKAPQHLREGGLIETAEALGWSFRDIGDLDLVAAMNQFQGESAVENVKNCERIGLANKLIHEHVLAEAARGNFVLTVGGDHSIASATLTAMKFVRKNLSVLWIDAHADSNTPETSPSGNYHGMSAAHAMNWIPFGLPGFEWLTTEKTINDNRVALIALRDVDQQEKLMLRESGVAVFTMHEIDRWGIGQVMDMALHRINPHSDRPIHITFDIDACDPDVAPGTGTCSRGGLSLREAHYICERAAMTDNLCGMDLVEINPDLDEIITGKMHGDCPMVSTKLKTVRFGIELCASALGRTIL